MFFCYCDFLQQEKLKTQLKTQESTHRCVTEEVKRIAKVVSAAELPLFVSSLPAVAKLHQTNRQRKREPETEEILVAALQPHKHLLKGKDKGSLGGR